jgi:hypothetical protein
MTPITVTPTAIVSAAPPSATLPLNADPPPPRGGDKLR